MARMYEKGIVAVPKHICEEAGFREGSQISFKTIQKGQVMIMIEDDWAKEFEALRKEGATATGKEVEEGIKKARAKLYAKWSDVPGR